jgi:hypothetical protein
MSERNIEKLPAAPEELNKVGEDYWLRLGEELIRRGDLTKKNLEQLKNLAYWEQQKEGVHELLKQGSRPFIEVTSDQVEETRSDVLLSNLKAIQHEIDKLRKALLLETDKLAEGLHSSPVIPMEAYDHLPGLVSRLLECVENERHRDLFLIQLLPVFTVHLPNVLAEHADGIYSTSLFTAIISDDESVLRFLKKSEETFLELKKLLVRSNQSKAATLGLNLIESSVELDDLVYSSEGNALLIHDRPDVLPSEIDSNTDLLFQLYKSVYSNEPVTVEIGRKYRSLKPDIASGTSIFQFETLKEFGRQLGKNHLVNHLVYILPQEFESQTNRPTASGRKLNRVIPEVSSSLAQIYQFLDERKAPLYIDFTDEQWEMIDGTFHEKSKIIKELRLTSTLERVNRNTAVAVLKIASVFAVLRAFEQDSDLLKDNEAVTASDSDVIASLWIADTLLKHAYRIYQEIPDKITENVRGERYQKYFSVLPPVFKTDEAVEIASKLNIPERTAKRYLSALVKEKKLLRMKRGTYQKS